MNREMERQCIICGETLNITVNEDGKYTGGHYFSGKKDGAENEYWECDSCFCDKPEEKIK